MITTGMYWVRQLSSEHMHVRHFVEAQQERELLLNALSHSIQYLAKEFRYKQVAFPWEHTTRYENTTIMYRAENKNTIAIVIYDNTSNHSIHAEVYIEYLSNDKKRCTLHMIP
jgi:hypothetical protein